MNNKDKTRKNKKSTRKVTLQYKDTRETLFLSRAWTLKRRKESLIIKIQSNTQSVKEVNRRVIQNEDYPIFRAQLKDRIVPRCLREKCRRHIQHKTKECQLRKGRKSKDKLKNHKSKKRTATIPLTTISDDECDGLQYDDISSGTPSSWTDDEIDALMESTRKRMKDSADEEWKLYPRQRNLLGKKLPKQMDTVQASRKPSLNSLDTLVLKAMETEDMTEQKINTVPFETKHDGVSDVNVVKRRLTYEPGQSLKRKACLEIDEVEHPSQLNTAANSKLANPKKKIKSEPLENKSNRAKNRRDSGESKLSNKDTLKKEEQSIHQQVEEVSKRKCVIKSEPPETNNNIISQPNYWPREDQKSIDNEKTNTEIDAVITKLEKNYMDMDYSVLNLNVIDIKQELYSDI